METHSFDPEQFKGLSSEARISVRLDGEEQTRAFGAWLAGWLQDGDVVGLVGNLGAGKTTLTQGLVEAYLDEEASSPTYTLVNIYEGDGEVFHFDLYRLEDINDLETVGYWDYIESGYGISLVEWLDRIPGAWPGRGAIVHLERDDGARRLNLWLSPDLELRMPGPIPWKNI